MKGPICQNVETCKFFLKEYTLSKYKLCLNGNTQVLVDGVGLQLFTCFHVHTNPKVKRVKFSSDMPFSWVESPGVDFANRLKSVLGLTSNTK